MAIDALQEKIRKTKNPSVVELILPVTDLPPKYSPDAAGYGAFCRELLEGLKGIVPAARFSFATFAMLGTDGMKELVKTLKAAQKLGYYTLLDAPELLSPAAAGIVAGNIWETYPCDGLVLPVYPGSDVIKPFLPACGEKKKDIFLAVRTGNKSAPEMQDLRTGSRLAHTAAADLANRYCDEFMGKFGYSRVGILAPATAGDTVRALRSKYPKLFFLLDGYDYPGGNGKNCSYAFDKLGRGAAACAGSFISCAWKQAESDGEDCLDHSVEAAGRMKNNLTRYITIL